MVKVPEDIEINPRHTDEIAGPERARELHEARERVSKQMAQKNIAESIARPYSEVVRTMKLKDFIAEKAR